MLPLWPCGMYKDSIYRGGGKNRRRLFFHFLHTINISVRKKPHLLEPSQGEKRIFVFSSALK